MRAPGQESRQIAKRWEVGVSAITSFNLGSGTSPSLFLRDQDEAPIFGSGLARFRHLRRRNYALSHPGHHKALGGSPTNSEYVKATLREITKQRVLPQCWLGGAINLSGKRRQL